MPFNPAPSFWLQGITVLSNEDLGNLPVAFVDLVAPNGEVFRLSVENDGTLITTGTIAAPKLLLTIDLAEQFPAQLGSLPSGFSPEVSFGPWNVPTRIEGTVTVDDDFYINDVIVAGDSPLIASTVTVNQVLQANTVLRLKVWNQGGNTGASGSLTVTSIPTN